MPLPVLLVLLFFFIIPVGGFALLLVKLLGNTKKDVWKGKVVDKLHKQNRDMDSDKMQDFYTLVIQTEDGRKRNMGVSYENFQDAKIGDKFDKVKGELNARKLG